MNFRFNYPEKNKAINLSFSLLFFGCTFLVFAVLFIRQPIEAVDTDLWYHLNGGRYFFDNNEIASNSFFSFLSPERIKVNYYWLFQVLVYKVYSFSGYHGLIFLRAFVFLLIISLLYSFLDKTQNRKLLPFIFMLFGLLLLMRCLLVRPHIFSFLFLILFIYILEIAPQKSICLPFIGLLWVNMHGIAYPVMILIIVSYTTGIFYKRIKNNAPLDKKQILQLLFLTFSMLTIFVSPHGTKLLTVPFISTKYASQYIQELGGRGMHIADFLTFHVTNLAPSLQTIFNIIFLMVISSVIIKSFKKKLRISHILLFGGATFLLIKSSSRFMYEFSLLSLPLLNTKNVFVRDDKVSYINNFFYYSCFLVLLISTYGHAAKYFSNPPTYPVSMVGLPTGISTFLKKIDTKGTVLNFPNTGGYLQWMLYPDYQIAMDMEVPHLFTDKDFFYVLNAFFDDSGFKNFYAQYNPSYITVPIYIYLNYNILKKFSPEYVCVFFDDAEALFVNKAKLPEIADEFALTLDPALLVNFDMSLLQRGIQKNHEIIQDLFHVETIYPNCKMINWAISNIFIDKKEYDSAEKYASRIIQDFPDSYIGYNLLGDIKSYAELYNEAILDYKTALEKTDDLDIYKKLSVCYVKIENYQKAYHTLKKGLDIYSTEIQHEDIFKLGLLALQLNKKDEARMLMEFADYKTPDSETDLKNRIQIILDNANVN